MSASPYTELVSTILDGRVDVTTPVLSPDGSSVCFGVSRIDLEANEVRRQLWLAPTDGSTAPHPLTAGDPGESSPAWSPDGSAIAFVSSRSEKKGEATLHVVPLDRGEVRTVATMPDGIEDPAWSPDGRWIAFTSRTRDDRYDAKSVAWQAPRRIETFFTRLDGQGFVFDRPSHVHVVAADGIDRPRNLTPGPYACHGVSWLVDSSGIVSTGARHEGWDLDLAVDLLRVDLTGDVTTLTDQTMTVAKPSVSPDGRSVAFLGNEHPLLYPQNVRVGVCDLHDASVRWISTSVDRTAVAPPVWIGDDEVATVVEDRGRAAVLRFSASTGATAAMTEGDQVVSAFDVVGRTLAAVVATPTTTPSLVVSVDDEVAVRDTISEPFLRRQTLPQWERLTVPTADGSDEIDVWIARPADHDPTGSYPVLLNVHGGPFTQYGDSLFDEVQFQTGAGFCAVLCNPRGSSGRDSGWGHAILGPKHPIVAGAGWGTLDRDDILAALDGALAHDTSLDRARVGMLGGSYGGFMATLLAAQNSDRFVAVCSERAVNNLLTEEWSSDIGSAFRIEHGPDPIEDPDEYWRLSPMRHARNIDVPMLLIHSEDDLRCPISQAEELFMTLRFLDKEVVFYRFPGETHELSRSGSPVHRRQRAEIILGFFAEHCHLEPDA